MAKAVKATKKVVKKVEKVVTDTVKILRGVWTKRGK